MFSFILIYLCVTNENFVAALLASSRCHNIKHSPSYNYICIKFSRVIFNKDKENKCQKLDYYSLIASFQAIAMHAYFVTFCPLVT